jgi:dTDP-4-amino-4,6-dideoxygalactose transaminase
MGYTVPFNKPVLVGRELEYIRAALEACQVSGDGQFTKRCQELLEKTLGVDRALLTTSCTHALEMAALLLGIQEGDQVVAPSFTFVSTVNAFALRGARPVFADIQANTLNIDPASIEQCLTPRTRAIVVVHYAGVACDMEAIGAIAARRGIPVVEDNAHGLFGTYQGRPLGSFGALATLSFHETKNIICGEGGALLINDPGYLERALIIREKGTDRSRFFRGEVDKYTWVDLGSSYVMSDMLAAFLLAQLEARDLIISKRRAIWERYREELQTWAPAHGVQLPFIPGDCGQAFHMFYLLLPSAAARGDFIAHLKRRGILSVFHYTPLHLSLMGRKIGAHDVRLPVTESVSDRLVRLPLYNSLSADAQDLVIEAILSWPA